MSFINVEEQFKKKINKYSIDEFYFDKGPNFMDLFINLLNEDDLNVNNKNVKKIFNKGEVKSDISFFICEKIIEIKLGIKNNNGKIDELNRKISYDNENDDKEINKKNGIIQEIDKFKKHNESLENEIKSAVYLHYMATNKIIDPNTAGDSLHYRLSFREGNEDFDLHLRNIANTTAIVPDNWRENVLEIFGNKTRPFAGYLSKINGSKYLKLNRQKINFSPLDIQCALAINKAINNNKHMIVNDNVIALYISGGMMALITFRKKTQVLSEHPLEEAELFRVIRDKSHNKFNTLYSISGHVNSYIKINTPDQYYILSKKICN